MSAWCLFWGVGVLAWMRHKVVRVLSHAEWANRLVCKSVESEAMPGEVRIGWGDLSSNLSVVIIWLCVRGEYVCFSVTQVAWHERLQSHIVGTHPHT